MTSDPIRSAFEQQNPHLPNARHEPSGQYEHQPTEEAWGRHTEHLASLINPMSSAPRDGTKIIGFHLEQNPTAPKLVWWSDSYSIHGLGGHWSDGCGQYGDLHFAGWIKDSGEDVEIYKTALIAIAGLFGITSPLQLIGMAENDQENYADILIRHVKSMLNQAAARERELAWCLGELHALVKGECPSLLNEDSGGSEALDSRIRAALAKSKEGYQS